MLSHGVLTWSVKSWYRKMSYLFDIRLYTTYNIILLNWSDFKRIWNQYHWTLREDDRAKKKLNHIEMKSRYNTCEKNRLNLIKIFYVIQSIFSFKGSSEYDICIIKFGSPSKRYDFEIFCFSQSWKIWVQYI